MRNKRKTKFRMIHDLGKNLIRKFTYNFYRKKTVTTIDAIYETLKDITTGANYKFPYGRTTSSQK